MAHHRRTDESGSSGAFLFRSLARPTGVPVCNSVEERDPVIAYAAQLLYSAIVDERRARAEALLHDQVSQLWNRHVTKVALSENEDRPDNLTRLILRSLGRTGPVRSSDVAADLGLSRASISRRVSWLEGGGLVESAPDPADGRASLVSLTPEGKDRLDEINRAGAEGIRDIAAEFTEDELEVFASLLARFNQRASARLEALKKRSHDHH
jgi:DNA-binding MarR family transcriptional regulator